MGWRWANLIGIFVSKLIIVREGECSKCGWCCEYKHCSHQNKDKTCMIYHKLDEVCKEHKRDHTQCIPPPQYPLRKWNKKCGYHFYIEGTYAEVLQVVM